MFRVEDVLHDGIDHASMAYDRHGFAWMALHDVAEPAQNAALKGWSRILAKVGEGRIAEIVATQVRFAMTNDQKFHVARPMRLVAALCGGFEKLSRVIYQHGVDLLGRYAMFQ